MCFTSIKAFCGHARNVLHNLLVQSYVERKKERDRNEEAVQCLLGLFFGLLLFLKKSGMLLLLEIVWKEKISNNKKENQLKT